MYLDNKGMLTHDARHLSGCTTIDNKPNTTLIPKPPPFLVLQSVEAEEWQKRGRPWSIHHGKMSSGHKVDRGGRGLHSV